MSKEHLNNITIPHIEGFKIFLQLEKGLSDNTHKAYMLDILKLGQYLDSIGQKFDLINISTGDIQNFLKWLSEIGIGSTSQARILSGIKAYYKFLETEEIIQDNPSSLIESPKIGRKLPTVLSIEEIEQLLDANDLSTDLGQRNKAIIEVLYGCGLRVSELINLKISNLHFDEGFIRVLGKGDAERLIPIGNKAIAEVKYYIYHIRPKFDIKIGEEDFVFLNRRGKHLTRVMIYTIIKNLVNSAKIQKQVSPHTFRHSFATHLVENGADLRVVQEMLGHKSILTTEIYTHIDRQYLRQTIIEFHPFGKHAGSK